MFRSFVYCISTTLLIGSLWFTGCYGKLSDKEKTLLNHAKGQKWDEMLKLAKQGVNVDIEEKGRSPLNYAALSSNAGVVEELIKVGVEQKVKQVAQGETVDEEQLKKDFVNKRARNCLFPIHCAVAKGDMAIFEVLVNHGADPKEDETLLHDTASKCNKELAHILIDKYEFSVKKTDSDGETPLHKAAFNDCDQDFMKIFISQDDDVNACDVEGKTPLHRAAQVGSITAVGALIRLGAELEIIDQLGRTPLKLAEEGPLAGYKKAKDTAKLLHEAIDAKKSKYPSADTHKDTTTGGDCPKEPQAKQAPSNAQPTKGSKH
ncbi:ankyrin repeats (3 copies) domain-containing protein [Ditylenchus destructor]|nr:ankyrin repeats (3 copies) domain-containing protein [Ditylenchus destructor]